MIFDAFPYRVCILFEEPSGSLHHQQTFNLLIEFERYRYYDKKSRCAERIDKVVTETDRLENNRRNNCDNHKEKRSEQSKTLADFVKIFSCRPTGSYAHIAEHTAVLLKVTCYVVGLKLNSGIEIAEQHYKYTQNYKVKNRIGA